MFAKEHYLGNILLICFSSLGVVNKVEIGMEWDYWIYALTGISYFALFTLFEQLKGFTKMIST